jgi:hypothetical protein
VEVEVEVKPGQAVDPQPVAAATHQQATARNHLVVAAVEAVPVVKKADQDQVLDAVAEAEVPAVADEPISQPERSQVHSSKSTIYSFFIVLSLFPTLFCHYSHQHPVHIYCCIDKILLFFLVLYVLNVLLN